MMRGRLDSKDLTCAALAGADRFQHVYPGINAYMFDYETEGDAAAAWVPELFDIPEPVRASLRFYEVAGGPLGPYREAAQLIFVERDGKPARFFTRLIANQPRAFEMYQRLGIPVSLGEVGIQNDGGVVTAWAERPRGIRLCIGLMTIDELESSAPQEIRNTVVSARVGGDSLGTHGTEARIEVIEHAWTFRASAVWSGKGQCSYTMESLLDPMHRLPVKRSLGARHVVGDGFHERSTLIATL